MQNIELNKGLLTELARCDRSFVMSLFWHNLNNDSLEQKGGVNADNSDVFDTRWNMMMNLDCIRSAVLEAGGTERVECVTSDAHEKIRNTEKLITAGGPKVILDGALEGNSIIANFSVMVVKPDNRLDVYCLSSKSGAFDTGANIKKSLDNAYKDVAPLMCVLKERYADMIDSFYVVGANRRYLTPYPDPRSGKIVVNPNNAMYRVNIDLSRGKSVEEILGYDPVSEMHRILKPLENDPFMIPDAELGSKCKNPYTCPFYSYCKSRKDQNSVFFYMPNADAKKLEENGVETMEDLLELSYEYPGLYDIPKADGNGTYEVSEIGLRELRGYEKKTAAMK